MQQALDGQGRAPRESTAAPMASSERRPYLRKKQRVGLLLIVTTLSACTVGLWHADDEKPMPLSSCRLLR